jgi:hypothetical protein
MSRTKLLWTRLAAVWISLVVGVATAETGGAFGPGARLLLKQQLLPELRDTAR